MAHKKRAIKIDVADDHPTVKVSCFKSSIPWNLDSMPTQRMADKLGHDHAWQVMGFNWDMKNRRFLFEVMTNSDSSEIREISYKDAAAHFGWKDLKFSEDGQIAYPIM